MRLLKTLTVLLAIPFACYCGYVLWRCHAVEVESDVVLEPGDAIELDVDGREPHRYVRFRPKEKHP